jgi:hypothetical protein
LLKIAEGQKTIAAKRVTEDLTQVNRLEIAKVKKEFELESERLMNEIKAQTVDEKTL